MRTLLFGMLPQLLPQLKTSNRRDSRIIIHRLCQEDLSTAHSRLLDYERIQASLLRIDGSSQPGRTGTNNNQIIHRVFSPVLCYTIISDLPIRKTLNHY